uniref:Uncharacterized protein n=1 Tax=Amphimedon queenslandica TaxID=400682 RepID=A0A1X7VGX7_AMPQE
AGKQLSKYATSRPYVYNRRDLFIYEDLGCPIVKVFDTIRVGET